MFLVSIYFSWQPKNPIGKKMNTTDIHKTIFLAAPKKIIWAYLTEKDKLGEWFHFAATDLLEGQSYTLLEEATDSNSKVCWGEVLNAKPSSLLSYTFRAKPMAGIMTTVNWKLETVAEGTRVTLIHEGIHEASEEAVLGLLMALDQGWDQHFSRLRSKITV